jgi:hypothetical protein
MVRSLDFKADFYNLDVTLYSRLSLFPTIFTPTTFVLSSRLLDP